MQLLNLLAAMGLGWGLWWIRRGGSAWVIWVVLGLGGVSAGWLCSRWTYGPDVFGLMQAACWNLFVHLPALAIGTAVLVPRARRGLLILAGALIAVGVDAFLIEPRALEVDRFEIATDKLDAPLRIALVADVQTDRVSDFEREAIRAALDAEPDLVLFAGDYVQRESDPERHAEAARFNQMIQDLEREAGFPPSYAVEGNMEWRWDWTRSFTDTPVVAMTTTQTLELPRIRLTGLTVVDSFRDDLALDPQPPADDRLHVVLGHAPDFALTDPDALRADLMVAGHIHGGQVQLPFIGPLVTFSEVPRSWAEGVTQVPGGATLVVSRGVGMERRSAPRLRFLCRPQIVILDLVPG